VLGNCRTRGEGLGISRWGTGRKKIWRDVQTKDAADARVTGEVGDHPQELGGAGVASFTVDGILMTKERREGDLGLVKVGGRGSLRTGSLILGIQSFKGSAKD